MKVKILYRYRDLELNYYKLESIITNSRYKTIYETQINLFKILPKKILELPKLFIRDIVKIK